MSDPNRIVSRAISFSWELGPCNVMSNSSFLVLVLVLLAFTFTLKLTSHSVHVDKGWMTKILPCQDVCGHNKEDSHSAILSDEWENCHVACPNPELSDWIPTVVQITHLKLIQWFQRGHKKFTSKGNHTWMTISLYPAAMGLPSFCTWNYQELPDDTSELAIHE